MKKVSDYVAMFKVSESELKELFKLEGKPKALTSVILIIVGVILSPLTLAGALLGYVRSYSRFMLPKDMPPNLHPLLPITRIAMILGAVLIWVVAYLIMELAKSFIDFDNDQIVKMLLYYFGLNILLTFIIFIFFNRWRVEQFQLLVEKRKFGSSRFALPEELEPYKKQDGLYVGGGYKFGDKGHILTVAGTRGGKGTNLIIPNLLGVGGYQGSWVVIDPKGENAAITARRQWELGQKVVILNPWNLLSEELGAPASYNPLDILSDKSSIHLVDDAQVISEMIIPIEKGDINSFFTDNARAILTGLILHLVTSSTIEAENRTLGTIWEWIRLPEEQWVELLADMLVNNDEVNGSIVEKASLEILKLKDAGEKTFGSIMATLLQATGFLKSHSMRTSLTSEFNPYELANGKTSIFVIIPVDKLQSHSRWLRLVVTSLMRAVVRAPDKKVCFLLDEFAALGYLPEIELALSTYAGYNVTVWPILQSLIQLKKYYRDNWETFVGNTAVRHYFSVSDNFTANYVSAAIGQSSYMSFQKPGLFGNKSPIASSRKLVTPDELMRASTDNIFAFIGGNHPTYFSKLPYYKMDGLIVNGKPVYDKNPYFR